MQAHRLLVLMAGALVLAACGDSPSYQEPTPPQANTQVPASAGASTAAYFSFARTMATSDTAAPLGLDLVTAPTSETEQPSPLQ
jgi:hypothetical protein